MSGANIDLVKQRFEAAGVLWPSPFDYLAQYTPEFVDAYLDFTQVIEHRAALEPKVRQFVLIALSVAATLLDPDGARRHIREAVRLGATREELIHVCQLATLLGSHTMPMAVPILIDEAETAGITVTHAAEELSAEVRARFEADRGSPPSDIAPVLALDPEYIDAYRRLSRIAVLGGVIEPKVVELIVIALDASTTHLHAGGTRLHIRSALAKGASVDEVLEVLEVTSSIGMLGTNLGVQLVAEAFGD